MQCVNNRGREVRSTSSVQYGLDLTSCQSVSGVGLSVTETLLPPLLATRREQTATARILQRKRPLGTDGGDQVRKSSLENEPGI